MSAENITKLAFETLKLHANAKARRENTGPSEPALVGAKILEKNLPLSEKTIAGIVAQYFATSTMHEFLPLAKQGFLNKQQAAAYASDKPGDVIDVMPGHVLSSQAFRESFYTVALKEKINDLNLSLLGNNPSKLHALAVRGFKWNSDNIREAAELNEKIRDIVFDKEALAQIKELEEKEKESIALQNWLAGHTISGEAHLHKERAAFGIVSKKKADELLASFKPLQAKGFTFVSYDGTPANSMAKAWAKLPAGGIATKLIANEVKSVDADGDEIIKRSYTFEVLIVVPENFELSQLA